MTPKSTMFTQVLTGLRLQPPKGVLPRFSTGTLRHATTRYGTLPVSAAAGPIHPTQSDLQFFLLPPRLCGGPLVQLAERHATLGRPYATQNRIRLFRRSVEREAGQNRLL